MKEQSLRIMPYSQEAEQAVIGAMIMDREAIASASGILVPEDFYQKQFGLIFEALVEINNNGKPADLVVLQNRLKEKNAPDEISNLEYIREILRNTETSSNIEYYAGIVKEKSILRRLIRTSEGIADMCYKGDSELGDILEKTEKSIYSILQYNNHSGVIPINVIAVERLRRIAEVAKGKGGITGIPTGFYQLDYKLLGLHPSDLVLIAARPSMGKTAFALNIAEYVAVNQKMPVLIFSLEMDYGQLFDRLLAMESRVNSQNIRSGRLTDDEWIRVGEGADTIGSSPIFIDDTSTTINAIKTNARKLKLENNIQLIIIDYLQFITTEGRSEGRQLEVAEISRSLKSLAKELKVPVVALSQLNRESAKRTDHKPVLSDLRDSGSIEQDADVVMFIHREEYYDKEKEENRNIATINIAKQRNGPIGDVNLAWNPELTRFMNIENRM